MLMAIEKKKGKRRGEKQGGVPCEMKGCGPRPSSVHPPQKEKGEKRERDSLGRKGQKERKKQYGRN